jgi:hypothetical protein
VVRETSECHRRLIGTGLSARLAYLIGVGGMATGTGGIGVETVVGGRGDYYAVAVNINIVLSRPAPGGGPLCADPIL